jgi:pSer/pThr/pTyr-binding forkhead associated (FHA) protein
MLPTAVPPVACEDEAVITCPKCFKENQDHYKFCLGCGAELPREGAQKKFAPGTPPHGVSAVKAASPASPLQDEVTSIGIPMPQQQPAAPRPKAISTPAQPAAGFSAQRAPTPPPPAPEPPAAQAGPPPITCPQCEHPNPPNNKFCASCGFKLARPMPSEPAPQPTGATAQPSGVVLTALRADGSEAGSYALPVGTAMIGRDTGAIFAGDSYLSPRHAIFTPRGGKLFVRDEGSLNGVYKKLRRDEPQLIRPGEIFRIGQEIVRYELLTPLAPTPDGVDRMGSPAKGYMGRIALIIGRDVVGNAFPVPEAGLHLGRERGDVLFPEDGYVSGLHCRLAYQNGQLFLTDLGSSNGSFIRLQAETEVINGDILLMGQQLFRINM